MPPIISSAAVHTDLMTLRTRRRMQVDGTCTANIRILRNRLRLRARETLGSTCTSRILGWKESAERLAVQRRGRRRTGSSMLHQCPCGVRVRCNDLMETTPPKLLIEHDASLLKRDRYGQRVALPLDPPEFNSHLLQTGRIGRACKDTVYCALLMESEVHLRTE